MRLRRRFPFALLSGVLAVALGVVGFWHFWLRRPTGSGAVQLPVAREAFSQVWTDRPVLLVGLGDSVTAGFGASPGLAYFDRLITNPPGDFAEMQGLCLQAVLPNLRATNLAVSGSTSLQHARSQWPRLTRQPTNVLGIVVMTTGGNDLIHHYGRTPPVEGAAYGATWEQAQPWLEAFAVRLEQILDRLRGKFPGGCQVFLANIYDPSDGTGNLRWVGLPPWPDGLRIHAAYNRAIAEITARRDDVHLVDIHAAFLGHGLYCAQWWRPHYDRHDPHYWYFANVEDPNDRGYDALRRLFLNAMADVLGGNGVKH
jgi:lysophospholipase L1-like esterase